MKVTKNSFEISPRAIAIILGFVAWAISSLQ